MRVVNEDPVLEKGEFSPPHRVDGVAVPQSNAGASTGSGGTTSTRNDTRKGSYENDNNMHDGDKPMAPAPPG